MAHQVLPIGKEHIDGFRAAVDSVARERRYLAMLEAPAKAQVRKYVQENLAAGAPHFVALAARQVVGWCDIALKPPPSLRHSGILGMGVLAEHRGRGLGRELLDATLKAAKARGIVRVELTVRADNERARRLYQKFGFVIEGLCRRHLYVDGAYHDSHLMALVDD